MQLHFIDILIIVVYLAATIFIVSFLSKRASKSMGSYYLGGNKLPCFSRIFERRDYLCNCNWIEFYFKEKLVLKLSEFDA